MMTLLSFLLLACDSETPQPDAPAAAGQPEPAAAALPPAVVPVSSSNTNQLTGYTGIFADDPRLSPTDIAGWAPSEFRTKRNEVFARYGRAFQSEDLQAHFGKTSWYTVNPVFSDTMLTGNDGANVTLIKSFEGETATTKAPQNGEYFRDNGTNLVIIDGTHAELLDQSDDMYNWTAEKRYWVGLGEWIITWEGPETWNPADKRVRNATLWQLNHTEQRIVDTFALKPQQG